MTLVRKASLADLSLVVNFIEKKAASDLQLGAFDGNLGVTPERISKALFGNPVLAYALLASPGAQPAGIAFYQFRFSPVEARSTLWVDLLYVDEVARRRGCGTALMHALGREAIMRECLEVAWSVDERDARGLSFSNRIGASVVSHQQRGLLYAISPELLAGREAEKRLRETRPPFAPMPDTRAPQPVASEIRFGVLQRTTSYKTLVAADVYRDGGSLEARFQCADGSFETIWLQASLDPEFGVRYIHTDLMIFADANREGAFQRIEKESPEEDALLDALHRFLRAPKVTVPFSHRTPDEHYLRTIETLIESIPNRI